MRACCARVAEYTAGLSREEFESRRIVYDATLRNLELLGEAARHVPEEARKLAPDIPWRRIVGVRNVLIHGYLGIDNDVVWDIVRNEVEKLVPALGKLEAASIQSDSGAKSGES
jgi:uncharacterized protein with HEPN domain